MLRVDDLDYELPPGRVALVPADPRDSARLLVAPKRGTAPVEHRVVRDLPSILRPGDLLVFNATKVIPARFAGRRDDTGGAVSGLYLGPGPAPGSWSVLLKSRRFRAGSTVRLTRQGQEPGDLAITLVEPDPAEPGAWIVSVADLAVPPGGSGVEGANPGAADLAGWRARSMALLDRVGATPLPPYISAARRAAGVSVPDEIDRDRYQTVLARVAGSVAAPTAGLHFTDSLLASLAAAGVGRAEVVLHVGAGTFRPVESEFVEQHVMHAEWCNAPAAALDAVATTKAAGGRVIAVGTTAARTLEAAVMRADGPHPAGGPEFSPGQEPAGGDGFETSLLIAPGHRWRVVDGLLTNFHLPRSTLLALVAALVEGGPRRVLEIYTEAIGRGYRFYSYGDAMLVAP